MIQNIHPITVSHSRRPESSASLLWDLKFHILYMKRKLHESKKKNPIYNSTLCWEQLRICYLYLKGNIIVQIIGLDHVFPWQKAFCFTIYVIVKHSAFCWILHCLKFICPPFGKLNSIICHLEIKMDLKSDYTCYLIFPTLRQKFGLQASTVEWNLHF